MFAYELDLLVGSIKYVMEKPRRVGMKFSFFKSLEQEFTITDDPSFRISTIVL